MGKQNRFREFTLSSGEIIFAGKNAENNDLLVKSAKRSNYLLHTSQPGSPFVNLGDEPCENDIQEASIFCASKSQDWRNNKKNVKVNLFKKNDCYKSPRMSSGTWGVKRYERTIIVKKIDIVKLENKLS